MGYKDMLDFDVSNGGGPMGDLTFLNGKLYGMTEGGGGNNVGCIFRINTNGSEYKDLYNFNSTSGMKPGSDLTLSGNKFYGMANQGGANSDGCIFSIDTNGNGYKDMFDFNGTNGKTPDASLILVGRILYGITLLGGTNNDGIIFSIDTNSNGFTDLLDFNITNGAYPSSLMRSGEVLYGMASNGGAYNSGLIFSFKDTNISTSIKETMGNEGRINIEPNPFQTKFTVAFGDNGIHFIEMYDVTGKIIKRFQFNGNQNIISGEGVSTGMYFIKIYNNQYQYVTTLKALKE